MRYESLLLESYGSIQLPICLLEYRATGMFDVGRQLQSEVLRRQQYIELLFGMAQLRMRDIDSGCKCALSGRDSTSRIDRPGRIDRRARSPKVVAEMDIAQRGSID